MHCMPEVEAQSYTLQVENGGTSTIRLNRSKQWEGYERLSGGLPVSEVPGQFYTSMEEDGHK